MKRRIQQRKVISAGMMGLLITFSSIGNTAVTTYAMQNCENVAQEAAMQDECIIEDDTYIDNVAAVPEEGIITSDLTTWTTGTYHASGEVTINSNVEIMGNVNLILDPGCVLTVENGIKLAEENSLTIDGSGKLVTRSKDDIPGIGVGIDQGSFGKLTINGGVIEAIGGPWSAGIGGGTKTKGGTVYINGGIVYASVCPLNDWDWCGNAAGIGGGSSFGGSGGEVIMTGGEVYDIANLVGCYRATYSMKSPTTPKGYKYNFTTKQVEESEFKNGKPVHPENSKHYIVSCDPIIYTISYKLNGGTVSDNPENYTIESDAITLNNPSREGYTFKGWTGSNGKTPQTNVTIKKGSTGNVSYTANWTTNEYSITYNLNGGSLPEGITNPDTYTTEDSVTLNLPKKEGYIFLGWTGTNGEVPQTEVSIPKSGTGDREYNANWVEEAVLEGNVGNNDWYVSKTVLIPPTGYQIGKKVDATDWFDQIEYEVDGEYNEIYYLKDNATDAVSVGTTISFKIDQTAPEGMIEVNKGKYSNFMDVILLKCFILNKADVTISGSDHTSDVSEISYFSGGTLSVEEVKNLSEDKWTSESEFSVKATKKTVIYARITDNAGNKTYLSTDGMIVYLNAEAFTKSITHTRLSNQDETAEVILNGNTVKEIRINSELLDSESYSVKYPSSNGKGAKGTITFKGDKLKNLEVGNYTLTVSYCPLGETYIEDVVNDSPDDTIISINVVRAEGVVSNISNIGKTYDGTPVSKPSFKTTNDKGANQENVIIAYKQADADDSTYVQEEPVNAGNYIVKVTVLEDNDHTEASATAEFTIKRATADVTVSPEQYQATYMDEGITLVVKKATNGEVSFSSNHEDIATVDAQGNVTFHNAGVAMITASTPKTLNYEAGSAHISITIVQKDAMLVCEKVSYQFTYGDRGCSVAPIEKEGESIITYSSSNEKVAVVDADGNVSIVGAGTAILTVLAAESRNYKEASVDIEINVLKKDLTIRAEDNTIAYGDLPSGNGVKISGLVNGDTLYDLGGKLTYTSDYHQFDSITDDEHIYSITPTGCASDNYEISYEAGLLTVEPFDAEADKTGIIIVKVSESDPTSDAMGKVQVTHYEDKELVEGIDYNTIQIDDYSYDPIRKQAYLTISFIGNYAGTRIYEYEPIKYELLFNECVEDKNAAYTAREKGLKIRSNGALGKFRALWIDGEEVDASMYRTKSGSTIIELSPELMKCYKDGNHTLKILYLDGEVETDICLLSGKPQSPTDDNPSTGDDFHVILLLLIMTSAAFAAMLTGLRSRKSSH